MFEIGNRAKRAHNGDKNARFHCWRKWRTIAGAGADSELLSDAITIRIPSHEELCDIYFVKWKFDAMSTRVIDVIYSSNFYFYSHQWDTIVLVIIVSSNRSGNSLNFRNSVVEICARAALGSASRLDNWQIYND